ncbi:MAG: response regulator [Candidatus Entotheonellia bacterium]
MGDAHRILVVDDELGPREALRMILKSKYQVLSAVNGPDALQVLSNTPPDIVLLDIKMREMNGIEVLKAIKEADTGIEVIMMTAYASLQTARDAIAHGASEYLIKPFSKKEVEEAIEKALKRRAERTGAQQDVRTLLDQLRTLAHSSTTATAASEVFARAAVVLAQVQRLLGASTALLYFRDDPSAPLRCEVALDVPSQARQALETPEWKTLLRQTMVINQPGPWRLASQGTEPVLPAPLVESGYTSALLCRISITQDVAGVLTFLTTTARALRADGLTFGQTVADLLAFAIHTQQRYQASQQAAAQHAQRAAQLGILRTISQVILGQLELSATLQAIGEQLQTGLGYAGFHVWLTSPSGHLQEAHGSGRNLGWQPHGDTPPPTALQVVEVPDAQVILAPIILSEHPVGVLKVVRDTQHGPLAPVELDLLRMLLDSIALAVHNSRLYGEIAATKSFLENLVQDAGDAIITVDTTDCITSWNASAERIFHASAASMLQQSIGTLLPADQYAQWREEVERRGQSLQVDTHLTPRQSSPCDVLLTLSPLRGTHDIHVGLSIILKDVTEERRLREQVLHAEKLRAVGEMAAGIAHNFNNVLTTILTRAQILAQQVTDTVAVQRGLTLIEQAASDGAALVRRLQQLARGSAATERAWLDLNVLVQEVVETTQPLWHDHARREGRPVEVHLSLTPLPRLLGRAAELREVLTNLLLNAIEAMPRGGQIMIRTWTEASGVCVAVGDTGVGMTAEVRRRLFDPFFTTKGTRGTGLGLSVSQAIIKGHHGMLTVDSEPDRGTTFVITLPCSSEVAETRISQVVA